VNAKARSHTHDAFGAYVRTQRQLARLSLRQAAALARISNPYLSQIENGLALPSVTVISALADVLHVSADSLLLLAAGMTPGESAREAVTEDAIRNDSRLDEGQKRALLAVLASFVEPSGRAAAPTRPRATAPSPQRPAPSVESSNNKPRPKQPPKARTEDT
jgi:transcriptional regulator with XRE-family HTH domain